MTHTEGEQVSLAFIAHIEAANPNGPRYRASMTDGERRSFANLILLCKPHHGFVDDRSLVDEYPVALLKEWKLQREKPLADQLDGLKRLTSDNLREMLEETAEKTNRLIRQVGHTLREQGNEILSVIAEGLDGIADRPFLDDESVAALSVAASKLENLGEFATMLGDSATKLAGLRDTSYLLHDSASKLRNLEDNSSMLFHAAREIDVERLESVVRDMRSMVQEERVQQILRTFSEEISRVSDEAANRLERAVGSLDESVREASDLDLNVEINDPNRIGFFKAGVCVGLLIAGLLLFAYLYLTSSGSAQTPNALQPLSADARFVGLGGVFMS